MCRAGVVVVVLVAGCGRYRFDPLGDPAYDQDLRLSPDRRHAVFSSQRSGAGDLYEAFR